MVIKKKCKCIIFNFINIKITSFRENEHLIKTLIKEYEESEAELVGTKKLYDQFQQLILQENEKQRKRDIEINSIKKLSSDISSTGLSSLKSNSKSLKEVKSSPSVFSTKSVNLESKLRISKTVERRIHHLENYKNILKQSKVPSEKLAFVELLNNLS